MRQNRALDASCTAFLPLWILFLCCLAVYPFPPTVNAMPQTRLIPALKTTAVWAESAQPCTGRTVTESITAKTIPLFPTIPLLNSALPHVLSNYWSHFCPVLLSFRSNSLQTKQSRPVWEQVSKRFIETNTEMVLFGSQSPFWSFFWEGEHWRSALRLFLRNYS